MSVPEDGIIEDIGLFSYSLLVYSCEWMLMDLINQIVSIVLVEGSLNALNGFFQNSRFFGEFFIFFLGLGYKQKWLLVV